MESVRDGLFISNKRFRKIVIIHNGMRDGIDNDGKRWIESIWLARCESHSWIRLSPKKCRRYARERTMTFRSGTVCMSLRSERHAEQVPPQLKVSPRSFEFNVTRCENHTQTLNSKSNWMDKLFLGNGCAKTTNKLPKKTKYREKKTNEYKHENSIFTMTSV